MTAVVSGWSAVAAIGLLLLALAIAACIVAMRGLMSTLAVAALSFPLMWLLAKYVFGDASVYFPQGTFSDGADGKDQIIIVSVLCTILGGVTAAAGLVWAIRRFDKLFTAETKL